MLKGGGREGLMGGGKEEYENGREGKYGRGGQLSGKEHNGE